MIDVSQSQPDEPLRVILGAGEQQWPGWMPTHKEQLDLTVRDDWQQSFAVRRPDRLLCEHVWEHLTSAEATAAAQNCFDFLAPGGNLRVAVPDANFRDEAYQRLVAVGQLGHQVLYDYRTLASVFTGVGFEVDLLEYCDESGRFHYRDWNPDNGPVYRSLRYDHRNKDGRLGFVSLILDAKKPATPAQGERKAAPVNADVRTDQFHDRDLVARLQRAYADKTESQFRDLARVPGDPFGVQVRAFDTTRTFIARGHDWQNRVTLVGDEDAGRIDDVIRHFDEQGQRCHVEWNPGNCYRPGSWNDDLGRLLLDRGFRPLGFRCVWAIDPSTAVPSAQPAGLDLRHFGSDALDNYLDAVAAIKGHDERQRADKATEVRFGEGDPAWRH